MNLNNLKKIAEAATPGPWERSTRPSGPFWHISSGHTINGQLCQSGRQAIGSVHAENKKGSSAYAAMFQANASFIAEANPETVLRLIDRIEELERQLAAKETLINEQNKLNKERQEWALHTSEIIRNLNRQLAEREKDAERYRWLRDPCNQRHEDDICVLDSSFNTYFGQDLDCAINTALQSQKGGV